MKKTKVKTGITLISLVITVILLLILGGVAISIAVDSNGLFARAKKATEDWNTSVTDEQTAISNILNQFDELEVFPKNKPNAPELLTGMTPVKFTLPEGDVAGTMVDTNADDPDWYNYEEKMWANAKTADGSLWVWIPRYAYKLNPSTQTADVIFLQGITDNYYDVEGNIVQAKRCTDKTDVIDTTSEYAVHPAFTDESSAEIDYRNGGWDKEISGIWVAKFEAGYAGSGNSKNEAIESSVNYKPITVWTNATERGENEDGTTPARNWLDGIYDTTSTAIKYPVFQPLTYSMNYINHNDAFLLCRDLENGKEMYGFDATQADTHMMKDSEWGMIAYLSKSQYGLGTTDIYVNNITLNSGSKKREETETAGKMGILSAYAITGVAEGYKDETNNGAKNGQKIIANTAYEEVTTVAVDNNATEVNKIYKWNQIEGQKASSTGNMYGIYDLSGGVWERTANYITNNHTHINSYGKALADAAAVDETKKYVLKYTSAESETNLAEASKVNYTENKHIYGTAIGETSTDGMDYTSWYNDVSCFPSYEMPFNHRRRSLVCISEHGLFAYTRGNGSPDYRTGFRAVAILE